MNQLVKSFVLLLCIAVAHTAHPIPVLSQEHDDEFVLELNGEEVPEDYAQRVFKNFRAVVMSSGTMVLDIEKSMLVTYPNEDLQFIWETMSRSVRDEDGNREYFIQIETSPQMDGQYADYEARRTDLVNKIEASEHDFKRRKELTEELLKIFVPRRPTGGAFCFDGDQYSAMEFRFGHRFSVGREDARRITGYVPFRVASLLTAQDMGFSHTNPSSSTADGIFKLYGNRPDKIKLYADGSSLVSWMLVDGFCTREVFFDSATGGLPVRLSDTWKGDPRPLAETRTKWKKSDDGRFMIEHIDAFYRSPGLRLGRPRNHYVSMVLDFSWTVRDDTDFFNPAELGKHMPFGGAERESLIESVD